MSEGEAGRIDALAAEFWEFSLGFYGRPEIAETCLACQDQAGLDVNLILLCCWYGMSRRGRLDIDRLRTLQSAVAPWRDSVLLPLRTARRGAKTHAGAAPAALRASIAALELEAEKIEQALLIAALDEASGYRQPDPDMGGFEDARSALQCYCALKGADFAPCAPLLRALQHRN